jgi:hypothetical protein
LDRFDQNRAGSGRQPGPNEVIQAQYRRLPPDRRKVVAIRRFNEFGQPADEADA